MCVYCCTGMSTYITYSKVSKYLDSGMFSFGLALPLNSVRSWTQTVCAILLCAT